MTKEEFAIIDRNWRRLMVRAYMPVEDKELIALAESLGNLVIWAEKQLKAEDHAVESPVLA